MVIVIATINIAKINIAKIGPPTVLRCYSRMNATNMGTNATRCIVVIVLCDVHGSSSHGQYFKIINCFITFELSYLELWPLSRHDPSPVQ